MSAKVWNVVDLLKWTTDFFKENGVPSPRLDTELLLAHVLGVKRLDLYLAFDQPVSEEDRGRFRELVRQRGKDRLPVAYLTGEREFWSLPFVVTPDVLTPRPDTEKLVEVAVALKPGRVAELGVGSGCVSAAIARELADVTIAGIDISPEALSVASKNFEELGVAERIELFCADSLDALTGTFDVIVSNPPYIRTADLAGLPAEVGHEPRVALDGGEDGLDVVRALAASAPAKLNRPGWLAIEIGHGQADATAEICRQAGAADVEKHVDLAGIERVVCARFEEA